MSFSCKVSSVNTRLKSWADSLCWTQCVFVPGPLNEHDLSGLWLWCAVRTWSGQRTECPAVTVLTAAMRLRGRRSRVTWQQASDADVLTVFLCWPAADAALSPQGRVRCLGQGDGLPQRPPQVAPPLLDHLPNAADPLLLQLQWRRLWRDTNLNMMNTCVVIKASSGARTFRTVLLSDVGVRPTQRANLQGSPSMCSVTPSSEVWESQGEEWDSSRDRWGHRWGHRSVTYIMRTLDLFPYLLMETVTQSVPLNHINALWDKLVGSLLKNLTNKALLILHNKTPTLFCYFKAISVKIPTKTTQHHLHIMWHSF